MTQSNSPALPAILSTWSFGPVGNVPGFHVLAAGGSALDAACAAAVAIENDPTINSVGLGGLPDASGRPSLDACVMTNPHRCGSVAFIRRFANPSLIARRVMEKTIHVMLVGQGAEEFAEREGFQERELLTPFAEAEWRKWSDDPRSIDRDRYRGWIPPLNVEEQARSGPNIGLPSAQGPSLSDGPYGTHDTVTILAIDRDGTLAGVCTTSGMAFKVPGRVGDSPIIGHGLYVDQLAGAAGATGTGELIMGTCASFAAVEAMRRGASPLDAVVDALERIRTRFTLDVDHQVAMIAMARPPAPDPARNNWAQWGGWASAALKPGFSHTITTAAGTDVAPPMRVLLPDARLVHGPTKRGE
jgi:N4-(beta-N-acetylglucosaminyl)-L-asparaginase